MGTSFIRTPGPDGAPQRSAKIHKEDAARYAASFLVRPNLMTWSAAVYYTQVDPDTVMVCCTAPWFSWTCLDTAGRSAARGSRHPLSPRARCACHGRAFAISWPSDFRGSPPNLLQRFTHCSPLG